MKHLNLCDYDKIKTLQSPLRVGAIQFQLPIKIRCFQHIAYNGFAFGFLVVSIYSYHYLIGSGLFALLHSLALQSAVKDLKPYCIQTKPPLPIQEWFGSYLFGIGTILFLLYFLILMTGLYD